ncbi:UBC-like protein [Tilletiaria anomala UBC 951]|uniref:UBC-like protein n=1 Tax=Tilletiaria anomala (strain ATCC 24038 / CBS 436.72 / UBC 951) TaxID=1037660 RepID=A0A066WK17_TILAU|nr:UBC-like protein [Tilletiaria anomala UBC 951]KDN52903.1 UBC-like protein [Tilletiaria anomala UBC 951]
MSNPGSKRLAKELVELQRNGPPAGTTLISADNLEEWLFELSVLGRSVFENEKFRLRFRFSNRYPWEAPEVVFVTNDTLKAPEHPHVYSNGHICASILANDWSPVLSVSSVLLTLQSMLASCKRKERPPDNEKYTKHSPISPKDTRWVFHDDTV